MHLRAALEGALRPSHRKPGSPCTIWPRRKGEHVRLDWKGGETSSTSATAASGQAECQRLDWRTGKNRSLAGLAESESERFNAHSVKATLLSRAAKADLSAYHRRLMGAHVGKADRNVVTHRDALATSLEKIDTVMQATKERRSFPDADRTGRWVQAAYSTKEWRSDAPGPKGAKEGTGSGSEEAGNRVADADMEVQDAEELA